MATTTTVHAQLIRYTTNGDQIIVNLKSAGSDISIDRSTNTKLPSTVSSAQTLADALGNLAFKNSLGKGDVGLGNVDNTADSAKSVKYATSAGSAGSVAWANVSGKPSTYHHQPIVIALQQHLQMDLCPALIRQNLTLVILSMYLRQHRPNLVSG